MAVFRIILYSLFISWTLFQFIQTRESLRASRYSLSRYIQKTASKTNPTARESQNIDSETVEQYVDDGIFCPLSDDTNLIVLVIKEGRYFIFHKNTGEAYPMEDGQIYELGRVQVVKNDVWLMESTGKTLKSLVFEYRMIGGKKYPTLNYFGDSLSKDFCGNERTRGVKEALVSLIPEYYLN